MVTEALDQNGAAHVALGGTVTQTSSVRFGDIAGPAAPTTWSCGPQDFGGPDESDGDLRRHAEAFCTLVATAAGLPARRDRPDGPLAGTIG